MKRSGALSLRVVAFLIVFAGLQFGWQALRGSTVEHWVVHHGTVQPAAFFIRLATPAIEARAEGFSIKAPGGGLNVLNGCEGLEVLFLLVAAFLVAPVRFRTGMAGMLLGVFFIFLINQARLLILFYAWRSDPSLFQPLHAYVTPIALVLLVAIYFYVWIIYAPRDSPDSLAHHPAP